MNRRIGSGAKGKEVVENLDPRLNTESVLTLSVPGWTHLPVPPKYRVAGPLKGSSPFVYMQMLHALAPPPLSRMCYGYAAIYILLGWGLEGFGLRVTLTQSCCSVEEGSSAEAGRQTGCRGFD